jgi:hypothetical protein
VAETYREVLKGAPFNYLGNQYGRTSFLFGGVRGMQLPVSFYKDPASDSGMTIYEQVHNASIFSLFLPAANVADVKRAMDKRNYTDTAFYHTLFMSNHMESDTSNSRTASAARCSGTTSTAWSPCMRHATSTTGSRIGRSRPRSTP